MFSELISFENIMGKEAHILRVVESMQATVDTLSKEVLIAISREEMILKEEKPLILMFLMLALWG